ncbi:MAG: PD-(D/E)XK nuclease family protein, partial [Planctomycetota bacterium]
RQKGRLGCYARALEEPGIPHQVTGGSALNDVRELDLLCRALRAASEPDNPVALVAALRSELFGVSDAALYAFRRAEGEFSFRSGVPEGLASARDRETFADAFARLARYARWLETIPPAAAVERVVGDLGLAASAAASLSEPTGGGAHRRAQGPLSSSKGGAERAGSLAKAVELLRAEQSAMPSETWSVSGAVDYLEALARGDEKHDGASARPVAESAVRVMNLHKVKGLEAPVVFLADPIGEFQHPVDVHIDRSGDEVRGYLALHGERRGNAPPPLLARPRDWEEFEAKEKRFGRAEATRLLYVAATRAGSGLVVTQRAKGNHLNPWKFFAPRLEGLPELADPGPQRPPPASRVEVAEDEPARSAEAIRARWEAAREPSYSLLRAKEDAVEAAALLGATDSDSAAGEVARAESPPANEEASPGLASGEHGTEWGEVIHALLEAAMASPEADLRALAQVELAEHGLEPSLADEAVETVKGVVASDIWRRARESPRRLVEVPFQLAVEGDGARRAIVRGVIDLAFREDRGWIIVDYKTDRATAASLGRLVERYRPQLAAYAAAWRKCVGEPVREAGILFVRAGCYRAVTRPESG